MGRSRRGSSAGEKERLRYYGFKGRERKKTRKGISLRMRRQQLLGKR